MKEHELGQSKEECRGWGGQENKAGLTGKRKEASEAGETGEMNEREGAPATTESAGRQWGEMVIQTAALPSLASPCLTQGMANDGRNGVKDWIFLDVELTEVCHLKVAVKISSSADADADVGGLRTPARGPGPF